MCGTNLRRSPPLKPSSLKNYVGLTADPQASINPCIESSNSYNISWIGNTVKFYNVQQKQFSGETLSENQPSIMIKKNVKCCLRRNSGDENHVVMNEKVQALAGSIYEEFEKMLQR